MFVVNLFCKATNLVCILATLRCRTWFQRQFIYQRIIMTSNCSQSLFTSIEGLFWWLLMTISSLRSYRWIQYTPFNNWVAALFMDWTVTSPGCWDCVTMCEAVFLQFEHTCSWNCAKKCTTYCTTRTPLYKIRAIHATLRLHWFTCSLAHAPLLYLLLYVLQWPLY